MASDAQSDVITTPAKRGAIGAILLARGAVSEAHLAEALSAQRTTQARIGSILFARGWASGGQVAAAAAEQYGLSHVDLDSATLDPALGDPRDVEIYLRRRLAPLRVGDGEVALVAADVGEAVAGIAELAAPPRDARIVLADPVTLDAAIASAYGVALAARAAARTPAAASARTRAGPGARIAGALALVAAAAGAAFAPAVTSGVLFLILLAINAGNAAVRVAVLATALRAPRDPVAAQSPGDAIVLAERRAPPKITLLIPLLREVETLPVLIAALEALDWPRELLDVKLILEADDLATLAALRDLAPPPFCRILIAPPGGPRTKPRALNFALDFAEGEIVGIYDAEDRPDPDQLRRVVDVLRASPPEVACVQARLSYYNPRENWLTRCFAIEYAIWFDVLIRGFRELRLPIPLGGTSVFFRRAVLEEVGAWDAHNVTEDADLGMRLARAGYRCEVTASTTHEEASSRLGPWIRQRSRWLKGYMMTWLVHMRRPLTLLRELGPAGFAGFQALFLGAAAAYLGLPFMWAVWGLTVAGVGPAWLAGAPGWALGLIATVQLAGWIAMIVAGAVATTRRRQAWLLPWIPTLAIYWPIGAFAAYVALVELFVAPALWRKTPHGLGQIAADERARALEARGAGAQETPLAAAAG
jgi:cellulose synthase/poly-beta-1,6-N-acetylglucosamine synthase-like glycosyltransferase